MPEHVLDAEGKRDKLAGTNQRTFDMRPSAEAAITGDEFVH